MASIDRPSCGSRNLIAEYLSATVGVAVGGFVGEGELVMVAVGLNVGVPVGAGVFVDVGIGEGVLLGDAVAVGASVSVGNAVGVGVGTDAQDVREIKTVTRILDTTLNLLGIQDLGDVVPSLC